MSILQPFLIALQLLTIIPTRIKTPVKAKDMGYSVLFYPLVGGLMASILVLIAWLLAAQSSWVVAVMVLSSWVILTGGLHLDGLADSADAWLGGLGDKEKTLRIMKDPASGPIAVVGLILVLLLKFIMLNELILQQHWISIVLAIVLARSALPLLFMTTPYVRKQGMAAVLVANIPHAYSWLLLVIMGLLTLWVAQGALLIAVIGVFLLLRYAMLQRLGGTTGDTAGAMVELTETVTLITAVVI